MPLMWVISRYQITEKRQLQPVLICSGAPHSGSFKFEALLSLSENILKFANKDIVQCFKILIEAQYEKDLLRLYI